MITIYTVWGNGAGTVALASAEAEVHGTQAWAPQGKDLGPGWGYKRRIDRADADDSPAAAISRFVKARRAEARQLRARAYECDAEAYSAERLALLDVDCAVDEYGVVIDTDREKVLAYLRAAPAHDRVGAPFYPPVERLMANALEKAGLVRLVDYQCHAGGCWLVDLLEKDR